MYQELGLQPEDNFVMKVVQLEELLHVRHSIFVIGNAGTGKSEEEKPPPKLNNFFFLYCF